VIDALRLVPACGVSTSPPELALKVTASVLEPVRAANGVIVIVAGAPGPITVLHVTGPDTTESNLVDEVTVSTTLAVMSAVRTLLTVRLNVITVVLFPFPAQLGAALTL
jgi:hypothetical protein